MEKQNCLHTWELFVTFGCLKAGACCRYFMAWIACKFCSWDRSKSEIVPGPIKFLVNVSLRDNWFYSSNYLINSHLHPHKKILTRISFRSVLFELRAALTSTESEREKFRPRIGCCSYRAGLLLPHESLYKKVTFRLLFGPSSGFKCDLPVGHAPETSAQKWRTCRTGSGAPQRDISLKGFDAVLRFAPTKIAFIVIALSKNIIRKMWNIVVI